MSVSEQDWRKEEWWTLNAGGFKDIRFGENYPLELEDPEVLERIVKLHNASLEGVQEDD